MIYKPDVQFLKNTPLSLDFAQKLPKSDKPRLIIASHKYLDEDYMLGMRLEFCQLPFGVYKFRA
jgi:adenine-specific DNA-methyltransferase